jgi:hypothetical protein
MKLIILMHKNQHGDKIKPVLFLISTTVILNNFAKAQIILAIGREQLSVNVIQIHSQDHARLSNITPILFVLMKIINLKILIQN